jgi:DNA-binding NtrC family response regulator
MSRSVIIVQPSALMAEFLERAGKAARSDTVVLLTGESGTGKTVVAEWIHQQSKRPGAFVGFNCATGEGDVVLDTLFGHERGAFTGADRTEPGLFEAADRGTLFLDEIGRTPLKVQRALLKAIDEKRIKRSGGRRDIVVEVRVVAATSADLEAEVQRGDFIEDLWHRISGICLHLPPLRERPEDVITLAEHFLADWMARNERSDHHLTAAALAWLQRHTWPDLEHLLRELSFPGAPASGGATMAPAPPRNAGAIRTSDDDGPWRSR